MDFGPLIVVGIILLVVAAAFWNYFAARKRREAMAAWAASIGASFDPGRDSGMKNRYPVFSCLKQGHRQYAYNIVDGSGRGRPMRAFDYHYETYSTDSKGRRQTHHHYFSAVVVDAGLPLRPLFLRPEGFFDKVTEFLGFDDIDFELNEFSRKFYVKAQDRKWAFDVIHQATMEFLLESPKFQIQLYGPHVMAWRTARLDVPEFTQALAVVDGILDRLPGYLLRELKGVEP